MPLRADRPVELLHGSALNGKTRVGDRNYGDRMGLIDRIRAGTYRADTTPTVVLGGHLSSLAEVGERITSTGELMPPVRDFVDQLCGPDLLDDHVVERLIADRPVPSVSEGDALLAGIAEHFAVRRGARCPAWAQEPSRFLDHLWFVSTVHGFRGVALAQTPISLKRRGVIWSERSMKRV